MCREHQQGVSGAGGRRGSRERLPAGGAGQGADREAGWQTAALLLTGDRGRQEGSKGIKCVGKSGRVGPGADDGDGAGIEGGIRCRFLSLKSSIRARTLESVGEKCLQNLSRSVPDLTMAVALQS